ncbi:hypothetical protein B4907_21295 [Yersinia kristensenii]|nr:hypothetical protein B4907_21295 [Yersinia kristensenii]
MVKQEALEDKCHNKRGKFLNLTTVRGPYRITIVNGKLIYKGFPLTTKESGRFKFIQDKSGDLFGAESSDDPDGIKHSSILGWDWPISAGTISATDGIVHMLSSSSGHFRPSIGHLNYTANYLRLNGVLVVDVVPFWDNENKFLRVNKDVISFRKKYMK